MARTSEDRARSERLGRSGAATAATRPKASLGERVTGGGRWFVTHPWVILIAVGVALFTIWAIGTREVSHKVYATFKEAPGLVSGEDVKVAGLDAGKVTKVTYAHGDAIVGIGIQDNRYWPLHQGTKAILRFGTTVGNGTRYIELQPGPAKNPIINEGGTIPMKDTVPAVEFDQSFNVFNGKTRDAFDSAMQGTGTVVQNRATQIGQDVNSGAPALNNLSGFTAELSRDSQSLHNLIGNGTSVTSALAQNDAQITQLVGGAAATFHAFATNTTGIQGSLSQLPPTLTHAQSTLKRLDTSIGHLNDLVTAVKPGAAHLRRTSADLLPVMTNLRKTIPIANQTLGIVTKASPSITSVLKTAQTFSTKAAPALTTATTMTACVRPYAPEIGGFVTEWASWPKNYDGTAHYARLDGYAGLTSLNATPLTPAAFVKATGAGYAFIRPPGYNTGQTVFDPSCGITADGLNPADDKEAGN